MKTEKGEKTSFKIEDNLTQKMKCRWPHPRSEDILTQKKAYF